MSNQKLLPFSLASDERSMSERKAQVYAFGGRRDYIGGIGFAKLEENGFEVVYVILSALVFGRRA